MPDWWRKYWATEICVMRRLILFGTWTCKSLDRYLILGVEKRCAYEHSFLHTETMYRWGFQNIYTMTAFNILFAHQASWMWYIFIICRSSICQLSKSEVYIIFFGILNWKTRFIWKASYWGAMINHFISQVNSMAWLYPQTVFFTTFNI